MKVSKEKLKQMIKEELEAVMKESESDLEEGKGQKHAGMAKKSKAEKMGAEAVGQAIKDGGKTYDRAKQRGARGDQVKHTPEEQLGENLQEMESDDDYDDWYDEKYDDQFPIDKSVATEEDIKDFIKLLHRKAIEGIRKDELDAMKRAAGVTPNPRREEPKHSGELERNKFDMVKPQDHFPDATVLGTGGRDGSKDRIPSRVRGLKRAGKLEEDNLEELRESFRRFTKLPKDVLKD